MGSDLSLQCQDRSSKQWQLWWGKGRVEGGKGRALPGCGVARKEAGNHQFLPLTELEQEWLRFINKSSLGFGSSLTWHLENKKMDIFIIPTYTYIWIYIWICIYMDMCRYVCVCISIYLYKTCIFLNPIQSNCLNVLIIPISFLMDCFFQFNI